MLIGAVDPADAKICNLNLRLFEQIHLLARTQGPLIDFPCYLELVENLMFVVADISFDLISIAQLFVFVSHKCFLIG